MNQEIKVAIDSLKKTQDATSVEVKTVCLLHSVACSLLSIARSLENIENKRDERES